MHEFELINKYFSKLSSNNKGSLKLNDDVFFDKSKKLVISVDTYVEGVHFINFQNPDLVIKKIIRSSISDLICKGVSPKYYFISGSGNKNTFSKKKLEKISKSLHQEQKKFTINLCGGDTTFSKKLSFTIISVGFSDKIIFRNKAKLNDDIYVTGNLGDSFVGLKVLQKKIHLNRNLTRYFKNKYFHPNLHIDITKKLLSIANTSIDISDGLVADLEKLINHQKLSYVLYLNNIPTSKNLNKLIKSKIVKKITSVTFGDDYQILFTASPSKSRIISKTSKTLGIKISKIGKICSPKQKSQIIDEKNKKIALKNKGYFHKF
ncbi:thiamine-phosphate kinase [Candidatus Pelagibacter sp. HIMB1483]|uniref:thiamine-phosphate kinase n=1 Tax=Candidatus Pelagibacter sp. HIMB1483 TaxID=3415414 RepID=UPI003F865691